LKKRERGTPGSLEIKKEMADGIRRLLLAHKKRIWGINEMSCICNIAGSVRGRRRDQRACGGF
jgi:hypothetical protein